jgi:hypothetical protein
MRSHRSLSAGLSAGLSALSLVALATCDPGEIEEDSFVEEEAAEAAVVPTSGLVGQWKLDGNATDTSTTPANGTLMGGPLWSTDAKVGTALSFEGVDDYVNLGNPTKLQLKGAMTLSAWVKISSFADSGRVIAQRGSSGAAGWGLSPARRGLQTPAAV